MSEHRWNEELDSDKAHERRVTAREEWWELNHGIEAEDDEEADGDEDDEADEVLT